MNDDVDDCRFDVIDWREGILKLHKPDGTSEDTIMIALSGPLHQQATAAVAVARSASIAACEFHQATESYARMCSGPDAGAVVDANTPGHVKRVDLCQCGAQRVTYITASHRKQGGTWT